jgi:hypothetical protein
MLSSVSRTLVRLSAICYLLLGAVLFLAPAWSSDEFPWNVSPFVVMTIGGWCLGNSIFAWQSARLWEWKLVYPSLIYLWLFGIFEAAVLVAFRDKVSVGSIVAWAYIVTIGINVLAAVIGIVDFLRIRPSSKVEGLAVPGYVRGLIIFFTLNLSILALGGLLAKTGGLSTEGGIFPEPLTLFTVRAFAAFFSAICLSALPLIWARNLTPMFTYGLSGIILIIPILIAAFVNLDKFDFGGRPGGILYVGAYIVTLVVTAWGIWHYRPALRNQMEKIPG